MLANILKEDREGLLKGKLLMIITRSRLLKWKMKRKSTERRVIYQIG
jgi:hypothetical protein